MTYQTTNRSYSDLAKLKTDVLADTLGANLRISVSLALCKEMNAQLFVFMVQPYYPSEEANDNDGTWLPKKRTVPTDHYRSNDRSILQTAARALVSSVFDGMDKKENQERAIVLERLLLRSWDGESPFYYLLSCEIEKRIRERDGLIQVIVSLRLMLNRDDIELLMFTNTVHSTCIGRHGSQNECKIDKLGWESLQVIRDRHRYQELTFSTEDVIRGHGGIYWHPESCMLVHNDIYALLEQ